MATSKLLANSNRGFDDAVLSRDVIDLALMAPSKALLRAALEKAEQAYPNVGVDLDRVIDRLAQRPGRLETCRCQMGMTVPSAVIRKHIKALRKR